MHGASLSRRASFCVAAVSIGLSVGFFASASNAVEPRGEALEAFDAPDVVAGSSYNTCAAPDDCRTTLTIALLDTLINPLDAFTLRETIRNLEESLPQYRWRSITLSAAESFEGIASANPDFVFAPTGYAANAEVSSELGSFRIATRKTSLAESASASVGAVFVVRENAKGISDLASLRGKRAGASIPSAVDGWLAAAGEILRAGYDPDKFFSSVSFSNNAYPDVISSLLAGEIDVAILPACVLETIVEMHLIDDTGLKVVNEKSGGLACRHSTELYPDLSLLALPHAPERAVRDVTIALLTLGATAEIDEALARGEVDAVRGTSRRDPLQDPQRQAPRRPAYAGALNAVSAFGDISRISYDWVTNVNDVSVQRLFRELRTGPYSYLRDMSFEALFKRYRREIVVVFILLGLLIVNEWRLQRTVERRTQELRDALEKQVRLEAEAAQIRERLAGLERRSIVQQMSGMIAHEINTPLGAVRNYAAFLKFKFGYVQSEKQPCGDEEAKKTPLDPVESAVLGIDREAVRISQIVSRVRGYAKATLEAHSPCDLRAILKKSLEALRAEDSGGAALKIKVLGTYGEEEREEYGLKPAMVLGNALELEILFLNLLRNGVRAARKGAGVPAIEASIEPVRLGYKSAWAVRIANSGDVLSDQAFDALNHWGDSVAAAPSGLGLGLTICRGIADSHGASFHFERLKTGGVAALLEFEALEPDAQAPVDASSTGRLKDLSKAAEDKEASGEKEDNKKDKKENQA